MKIFRINLEKNSHASRPSGEHSIELMRYKVCLLTFFKMWIFHSKEQLSFFYTSCTIS